MSKKQIVKRKRPNQDLLEFDEKARKYHMNYGELQTFYTCSSIESVEEKAAKWRRKMKGEGKGVHLGNGDAI